MTPLVSPGDFRLRLQDAIASGDAHARLNCLARLARDPLDFVQTIQLDKALTQLGPEAVDGYLPVRLAVLSTHTIGHLLPGIRVAGIRHGLRLDVHPGAFGQYRQELLDPDSPLHRFRPDLILLSLAAAQATSGVELSATTDEVRRSLDAAVGKLRELWGRARDAFGATPVQQTFLDVSEPLFGSFDRLVPASPARLVSSLNDQLAHAAAQDGVMLLDLAQASARDGIDAWFDVSRWLQGKMEIAPQAAPRYGELLARLIGALRGRSRKCLVLDLDNTLWGGVLGDEGAAGIVLGEGSARGEAHLALQRYAKLLKHRGVILAVCSKNEPALAQAAFQDHPEMALRPPDIAAFVANWKDKVENLRDIAQRLNIGLDSMVFVDDDPVERARVRDALPMVAVPELPSDPALYVRCIARGGYFEAVSFTDDDLGRGAQYTGNAQREALRGDSYNVEEFLRGLEMVVTHGPVTAVDLARATQLINKTNQFNITTKRYSPDEVGRFAADPGWLTLQFRLADRFGDNGLVSVMLLRPVGDDPRALDMDTWVMSCRVFGRRLEHEVIAIAVEAARSRGIESLLAEYIPTERNGVIRDVFEDLGFSPAAGAAARGVTTRWQLNIADHVAPITHIKRRAP